MCNDAVNGGSQRGIDNRPIPPRLPPVSVRSTAVLSLLAPATHRADTHPVTKRA